ncbi:MAG TPA: response regulator [Polyangiaceae bacterium]|nr:response regulator [Polyangiaceae bacterium]
MEVESAPDEGSTFRIYLPGTSGSRAPETKTELPAGEEPPPSWRILLVDDEPSFGKATARLLRTMGHEMELVMSGQQALQAVHAFAPDVVLLDLDLPDLSGEEILDMLTRRRPGL